MIVQMQVGRRGQIGVKSGFDIGGWRDGRWQLWHGELRTDFGLVKLQSDGLILLCRPEKGDHRHEYE